MDDCIDYEHDHREAHNLSLFFATYFGTSLHCSIGFIHGDFEELAL
jgi:hypothetical protein